MNIFILDTDTGRCARYHNDTHLSKMIVEGVQMLSTAIHLQGKPIEGIYKATHINHPCNAWVRASLGNYNWLCCLLLHMTDEYEYRKGKVHGSRFTLETCIRNAPKFDKTDRTPFAQCMPDEYKQDDAVLAYRAYHKKEKQGYYKQGKWIEYKWTKRDKPSFIL